MKKNNIISLVIFFTALLGVLFFINTVFGPTNPHLLGTDIDIIAPANVPLRTALGSNVGQPRAISEYFILDPKRESSRLYVSRDIDTFTVQIQANFSCESFTYCKDGSAIVILYSDGQKISQGENVVAYEIKANVADEISYTMKVRNRGFLSRQDITNTMDVHWLSVEQFENLKEEVTNKSTKEVTPGE